MRSETKLAGIVTKEPGTKRTYRVRWVNQNSDTLFEVEGNRVYGALTAGAKRAALAAVRAALSKAEG